MTDEISFNELKNLTQQVKDEKKIKLMERVNLARKDAIQHITNGCYNKMKEAASNGQNSVDIYSFEWVNDKNSQYDSNNNKIIFEGDIRLLDLLKKNNKDFFRDLNAFFNKNDNEKFHCGFHKENIGNVSKWYIYVSWADRKNIESKNENVENNIRMINERDNDNNTTYKDLTGVKPYFYSKKGHIKYDNNNDFKKNVKEYKKNL
jgi:hypothetical protein